MERFDEREILGWLRVDPEAEPERIELFVDSLSVAHTFTAQPVDRPTPFAVREFRIQLRDVWTFCSESTRLTIRHGRKRLMIAGYGWSRPPALTGPLAMADLATKLANGHVFSQFGRLQLSKDLDEAWRSDAIALYRKLSDAIRELSGAELCICYGTHLGAVRQGQFIGYDHDFDACFICKGKTGAEAKGEALALARSLSLLGFRAKMKRSCVYYYHDDYPDVFIDVFHLYFNAAGELQWPYGVASSEPFRTSDFVGYTTVELAGEDVTAIADPEIFAERIYGEGWRIPNPGFSWERMRVTRARDGIFTKEEAASH